MATVRQIAKDAGVSIGTVSRVLNNSAGVSDEARDRVLSAAKRSGYAAGSGAAARANTNVALLYTGAVSPGSLYDAAILRGMCDGIEQAGLDILILSAGRARQRGETIAQMLQRKGARGAIVRTDNAHRHLVRELVDQDMPFVVIADDFPGEGIPAVTADSDLACRRGLEHLIHHGHERIAIALNLVDDHDHARRLAVWREVLREHGLDASDRMIHRVPAYRDAGAVALRQLVTGTRPPTAVFCADPLAGVGMCHEAQRIGVSIPGQLSVLGFDDADQRFATFPRLSAVCQDAEGLGRAAFVRLDQIINHRRGVETQSAATPECWFEPHESTGPVQQSPVNHERVSE